MALLTTGVRSEYSAGLRPAYHLPHADFSSDTTPSSGQTTAPFVMQPQVQSPVHSHHLGAPYVYSTHPYMPGYELGMGAPQVPMLFAGQQPQGHGMRAPGPYYDTVATAQMAGAQHAGAHPYGLLHRVGLPHPAMSSPLTPTTALVSPSPKMSATQLVGPHVTGPPAYSGTVVPQGARLPTAVAVLSPSKPTNTNANNNQPHTPVRGGRAPQSHVTLTPRLPSATLGSGQPQNHPASRPSPSHAPTPLAQSAASHDTPQPINTPQLPSTLTDSRTAPTPFASTPSSDLSSAPPESPKPNGQAHAAAAL
jgi:hypothetical protein